MILRVSGAVPADPAQYPQLNNVVEALAIGDGIPKPAVYVISDPSPNAFSTGVSPDKAMKPRRRPSRLPTPGRSRMPDARARHRRKPRSDVSGHRQLIRWRGLGQSPWSVAWRALPLRAFPSPAGHGWRGEGRRLSGSVMWLCSGPRCSLVAGQAPGCGHPFGVPAVTGRGGMGRSAAGSGINQRRGRAARGGGQTCGRSRAARVRACSPGLLCVAAGQGPDLPVAQRVEDAGELLAGRDGLGDVAGLGAAAGDDAVLQLARRAAGGLVLDHLDRAIAVWTGSSAGTCKDTSHEIGDRR
jgi:hypothetical protein